MTTHSSVENRAAERVGTLHHDSALTQLLAKVQQRLWLLGGIRGVCWGALAAILTLLVGMWFDLVWELPSPARAAAWGCALVAVLGILAWLLSRTWQVAEAKNMARRIDATSGAKGELLNGFEFSRDARNRLPQNSVTGTPSLTAGLAAITVQRAEQLAERVQPKEVISPRQAVLAARWLAGTVVLLVIFSALCPTLAKTQWLRFVDPWSDTPPYSSFRFSVEPGDTDVLYGKGLDVRVRVDGPVAREVHLMVTAPGGGTEKLPMFPETNGTWRASLSRLTEDAVYLARIDRARSPSYRIHVITTPTIEDVQFLVTPPPHTHEPPTSTPLPKGGLTGLAGTRVQVTARSNRPLKSGSIQWKGEKSMEPLQMRPKMERDVAVIGEFVISQSARFELHVTDTDGQSSQEPFVGSVTLLQDQRPLVRILEPKAQSLATPTGTLPVVIDAEDDYGLARVELYRSLNDSRPLALEWPLPQQTPRRFREQNYLPLSRYDLQPGDEIKLFARVVDNNPTDPKGAESPVVTVRIISQADFERMVRVREGMQVLVSKYQQAERRLEKLAKEIAELQKELEQSPADSPLSDALQKRLEKLAKELNQEADAVAKAAAHILPYDIDKKLSTRLNDLADELKSRAEDLQKLGQDAREKPDINNEAVRRQLAKLAERLGDKKKQFQEHATEPLDLLAKIYPLMEDQARFTALVLWQQDLADRLATFKDIERSENPDAKLRLRDLQDEQHRARDELVKLLDDIENHVRQLPDDMQFDQLRNTATKFVSEVRSSGAAEEMTSAETSLTDFRGAAGYRHAEDAATILKRFLKRCQGMGEQGKSCLAFSPSLGECLGDSIEQLLADAGLSMGSKPGDGPSGEGGRGGYSTRRGNQNVGLYGGLPALGGESNPSGGFGSGGEFTSGNNHANDSSNDPAALSAPWLRSSSGSGDSPVPPRYRRRVNQYFQRVADELEAAGK